MGTIKLSVPETYKDCPDSGGGPVTLPTPNALLLPKPNANGLILHLN
jgi:hypothetical protein